MRPTVALLAPPNLRLHRAGELSQLGLLIAVTLSHLPVDFRIDITGGVLDSAALQLLEQPRQARFVVAEFMDRPSDLSSMPRRQRTSRRRLSEVHTLFSGGKRARLSGSRGFALQGADLAILLGGAQPMPEQEGLRVIQIESASYYSGEELLHVWAEITKPARIAELEVEPAPSPQKLG